jgi:F-type H+-transporting ATPase subunit gamma
VANTIILKRRIGSVRNTRQITKAMELVAASKMRRAQEHAVQGRAYRESAYSLLTRLGTIADVDQHPLFVTRPIKHRIYIVISSNSGLAGAYNANVLRQLTRAILDDHRQGVKSSVIAIGKKAAQFVRRLEGVELLAAYPGFGDHPTANDIRPVLNTIIEHYANQSSDEVRLFYTNFKSNIVQEATALTLLPARFVSTDEHPTSLSNVTFEPSVQEVLDNVTERLLEVQLWQAMLESIASEHSMRMLAMKNATDNATDLIGDLTLAFNTARQAAITQELAEITGGTEAISS